MTSHQDVLAMLEATSRTFYIPIVRLPPGLQEAVAAAYLCMRAIDEVEDHPTLDDAGKVRTLRAISQALQSQTSVASFASEALRAAFNCCAATLPEVTTRLDEWSCHAPESIAPRIWDATAAMADRMAHWAASGWKTQTEADLDRYTFGVAGAVGLLLSDLWAWYDGTQSNRALAIGFGRGLQAVNILRNRADDLLRGVDFFPHGWGAEQMYAYARRNLALADAYTNALPPGPIRDVCGIPLALAYATLDTMERGSAKLSRAEVLQIVEQAGSYERSV